MSVPLAIEHHYTPQDLAELWHLSPSKIRELFAAEPGVVLIGQPSRREGRTLKHRYYTMRIPESVAVLVHARLSDRRKGR